MPRTATCPDVRVLERLLLGQVVAADAEKLEAHVAACARCADTLQNIRTDDPLVEALRHTPNLDDEEQSQLVQALIPCLKRLRPDDLDRTQTDAPRTVAPVRTEHFNFLTPKLADDELGRLGRYRVLKMLGAGGMGMVFLVEDPQLQRRVALKVIKPELVQRPEVRERFLREARAVANVEHDNIVTIFHVEEANGVPILTMPLLRGESLEERIARAAGPLPVDETLRIGREVAAGLAAAHDKGLVHRDIKPGNIFLSIVRGPSAAGESVTINLDDPVAPEPIDDGRRTTDDGQYKVKILDFGLARAVRRDESGLSQAGAILGTPAYMAPEQGRGQPVDHRADLFSLGCVLYRMATGQSAFTGPDFVAVLLSVAMDTPKPPRELNPDVPPALAKLIEQLIAKKAEDRPASAHAVVETIQAIEKERAEARRPKLTRRRLLFGAAAAVVGSSGVGALLAIGLKRPPPPKPGEVTFEFDEPDVPLAIRFDKEDEKTIDPKEGRKHSLPPGTYRLRPTVNTGDRRLVPEVFVVAPGEVQTIYLRLVGELRSTGQSHDGPVTSIAVTPKQGEIIVLSASLDRSVGVWRPLTPVRGDQLEYLKASDSVVHAVAFAPDGVMAASGGGEKNTRLADFSIHLWDVRKQEEVGSLPHPKAWVKALAFSPDEKSLLSGAGDGSVYLWDVKAKTKKEWEAHNGLGVHAVAFSADGHRALTAGGDKLAILWDVVKGEPIQRLEGHGGPVRGVAFGPGVGEAVTACDDGLLRIWELKPDGKVREIKAHKDGVLSIAVSPDGKRLLSGGRDGKAGTIRLWDAAKGDELQVFTLDNTTVNSVAFTADGRRAVSGSSDRTVRLWELPY